MDRNPPDNPDLPQRPRPAGRPAGDRPAGDLSGSPGRSDPDATRPLPAPPRRLGGVGRLSPADLPPAVGADPPSGARRGARRLGDEGLPPPPRWALPPNQQMPAAASPTAEQPAGGGPHTAPPAAADSRRPASGASPPRVRRRWRRGTRILLAALGVILLGVCFWTGQVLFKVQQVAGDWFVTPPPRPAAMGAFPDWSKQERVNILLMGLDTRVAGDSRSDTMILVSIDPAHKAVGMLSIPRDLWVPIPGFGNNRINAAYQFGETNQVPGGGPTLAMQTVAQNFGVPVHYYAQIDFQGFRRIVDALGGVTIDVVYPLIDNEYPADYGSAFQRIYIPAGLQHMDGRTALQYVRSRHADSDLGRNTRQQEMLLAMREEGLQLNILGKLDQVLTGAQGALRTDLSFTQAGSLTKLAQSIPRDQVRQMAVTADMTSPANIAGNDVLLPHWDLIRPPVQTLLGQTDFKVEAASVAVMNGTDTPGLARQTADLLRNAGFTVPDGAVGNPSDAGPGRYPHSAVLDYTGGQKPATLTQLLAVLKLAPAQVRAGDAASRPAGVDLEVLIGEDFPK